MTRRTLRPVALLAVTIAVALVSTQDVAVQIGQRPGTRAIVGGGGPVIDRGYRPDARLRSATATRMSTDAIDRVHEYVPDEVLVKFAGGGPATADQRRAATALGAREITYPPLSTAAVVALEQGRDPVAVAEALAARGDVEYAQPSYLRQAMFVPNDPFFSQQWNLSTLNMERAWDFNQGAADSIVVAVIDSGVAFQSTNLQVVAGPFSFNGVPYPALGPITVPFAAAPELDAPNRFVAPFDFVWGDELPVDMVGHGTHVAGTVGQLTNNMLGVAGMAFNVRLMPIKVLGDVWDLVFGATPVCCGASDEDVAAAVRYAVDSGAHVINMSLGGPGEAPVIEEAIEEAVEAGVFVAISAGNSFEEGNPVIFPAASAASIDGAMSVGAIDRQRRRAFYSSTGSYVEIVAPGGEQRQEGLTGGVLQQTLDPDSANTFERPPAAFGPPRFDTMSFIYNQGTSMAAPHVAGLAALLMHQGITDPAAIEAAIKHFATDLGDVGRDDEFGYGLIDPPATLRGLGLAR